MDIVQSFYDNLAAHYDEIFLYWEKPKGEMKWLKNFLKNTSCSFA